MEIDKDTERRLRESYEDCLKLKERDELTVFGKGMLFVLRKVFLSS